MRWQAILLGVVASWAGAARAACDGIEMVTYSPDTGEAIAVSCHTGSELFLPWVDWRGPMPETIPTRVGASVTLFDTSAFEALGAYDLSEITRFDPWYDIPELDD
jgi:hypothetical protein